MIDTLAYLDFVHSQHMPLLGRRGYDAKEQSTVTALLTGDETKVQQHLKDETDVNTIVRRFGLTREMPAGKAGGVFGDFTGVSDYREALHRVRAAEEGFLALTPEVRELFSNDPGNLIGFVESLTDEQLAADRLDLEVADGQVRVKGPAPDAVPAAASSSPAPASSAEEPKV